MAWDVIRRSRATRAEFGDVERRLVQFCKTLEASARSEETVSSPCSCRAPGLVYCRAECRHLCTGSGAGCLAWHRRGRMHGTCLWERSLPEECRALIRHFVKRIEIARNKAALTYTIPMLSDGMVARESWFYRRPGIELSAPGCQADRACPVSLPCCLLPAYRICQTHTARPVNSVSPSDTCPVTTHPPVSHFPGYPHGFDTRKFC